MTKNLLEYLAGQMEKTENRTEREREMKTSEIQEDRGISMRAEARRGKEESGKSCEKEIKRKKKEREPFVGSNSCRLLPETNASE